MGRVCAHMHMTFLFKSLAYFSIWFLSFFFFIDVYGLFVYAIHESPISHMSYKDNILSLNGISNKQKLLIIIQLKLILFLYSQYLYFIEILMFLTISFFALPLMLRSTVLTL